MCGICGITYFDRDRLVDEHQVHRMCTAITHRGPDDEGIVTRAEFGMGMRRLSIIDLVTGRQPICNEDGLVWIVFNGEIYNHHELRAELEKKGHTFKTRSDTEAIVHAYEEYGEDCPNKLNGMFAFAVLDLRDRSLFLARDRLGIKPLYYYVDTDKFAFGSELKAILQLDEIQREVDLHAFDTFLTFEYIPAPLSIFKKISKLPAGHTLRLRGNEVVVKEYWDVRFEEQQAGEEELCERLVDLLRDSVKMRLMSDVPLGAFLSGGIDSSSIVALMSQEMNRPVETFSIGFKESSYNESDYARAVANHFGTKHHEFVIEPDAVELTDKLIAHLDEPFGDFSIFPTYLVSKMAREFVTVALSGDGGDELFGGYDTYIANRMGNLYGKLPRTLRNGLLSPIWEKLPPTEKKKGLVNRVKRFDEGMRLPEDLQHTRWMVFLQAAEKRKLYSAHVQESLRGSDSYGFIRDYFNDAGTSDRLNRQLYVDIKTYLVDDILVKVDRMSMAASLEARVPFLDHRFVEFAASIPGNLKLKGAKTKYLLKKAMAPHLPEDILTRGKEGFSIPIKNWLKADLKPLMLEVLGREQVKSDGFFDPDYVDTLVNEHLNGLANHSHRLWAMMVFGIWHNIYLRNGHSDYETAHKTSDEFATL